MSSVFILIMVHGVKYLVDFVICCREEYHHLFRLFRLGSKQKQNQLSLPLLAMRQGR